MKIRLFFKRYLSAGLKNFLLVALGLLLLFLLSWRTGQGKSCCLLFEQSAQK